MIAYRRPEHVVIARLLGVLDADLFERCRCFFAGGTAIVLQHGEYRLSRDVDFLCADRDGYRRLRSLAVGQGAAGLFRSPEVGTVRDFRTDQYGIRAALAYEGEQLRFEIVREGRITLSGGIDPVLRVPVLAPADQQAEKLLANADRCHDPAVACRDVIDLGALVHATGEISSAALAKALDAYGDDVVGKLVYAVNHLADRRHLARAATTLQMDADVATSLVDAVRREIGRLWPDVRLEVPAVERQHEVDPERDP